VCDGLYRFSYIQSATRVRTSDSPSGERVSTGAVKRNIILPNAGVDSKWWMLHASQARTKDLWRVRETSLDGAPTGRGVHWSSGPIWLLNSLSGLAGGVFGGTDEDTLEWASLAFGPLTFLMAMVVLAAITTKRFGWTATAVQLLVLGTCFPFYELFRLGETDHHGTVAMLALLCVLSLATGILGANAVSQPRFWFAVSGLFGAAALWVSAASQVPVLVGCGLGGLACALAFRRRGEGIAPVLWKTWGLYGCLGSIGFYLLEYFPSHMGWRLEVNHPVYALAWLGAAHLLARVTRKVQGEDFLQKDGSDRLALTLSLLAACLPALLIALDGREMFWVSNPFLLELHHIHIKEFQSLPAAIGGGGLLIYAAVIWFLLAVAGSFVALRAEEIGRPWKLALVFALCPAVVAQILATAQIRWTGISVAMTSNVLLLVTSAVVRHGLKIPPWGWALAGLPSLTALVTFPLLAFYLVSEVPGHSIRPPADSVPSLIARDVAHRLVGYRRDLPVVLSSPTLSSELTYYGGLHTIGTLYWENRHGLEQAVRMFSESDENKLMALLQGAGATHIVIFSWDPFVETSRRLLRPLGGAPPTEPSVIERAVTPGGHVPRWLRPLGYPVPASFGFEGQWVRIFEFRPDQSPAESHYYQGVYEMESSQTAQALKQFALCYAADPAFPNVVGHFVQTARAASPKDLDTAWKSIPEPHQSALRAMTEKN